MEKLSFIFLLGGGCEGPNLPKILCPSKKSDRNITEKYFASFHLI